MTQPQHRPERQAFIVRAGAVEENAILPEWWGPLDSDIESRSLRFYGDGDTWLDEDDLPESFVTAGCRLAEVVGVTSYPGLAHPRLEVGRRVLLQPDPTNPNDHDAIAVWTEDATQQVGYLPGNIAAETMTESLRRRTGYGAFVAREHRDSRSHERQSVTILLGPGVISATETT